MQPPPPATNPERDSIDVIFSGHDLTSNRDSQRKILPLQRPRTPLIPCLAGEVQSSGGIDTIFSKIDLQGTRNETELLSMDKLTRLKDSVLGYLSPKRQRIADPATPTPGSNDTPRFLPPASDSHTDRQDLLVNAELPYGSPGEHSQRKRARSEYEYEDVVVSIEETSIITSHDEEVGIPSDEEEEEFSEGGSDVEMGSEDSRGAEGADDDEEGEEEGTDLGSDEEGIENEEIEVDDGGEEEENMEGSGSGDEFAEEEYPGEEYSDPQAIAQAKVSAYLAQHHPLTEQRTSIARLQAEGDWHPEAIYVYERIQMRGYEPIIPLEWKMEFLNLPKDLFTSAEDNFSSCISDYNLWPGQGSRGHGWRSLEKLIQLSLTVSYKQGQSSGQIERCVNDALRFAIKWAEQDGGYHEKRFIPTIVVHKAQQCSMEKISTRLYEKLTAVGRRHREWLGITEDEHGNFELDPNKRAPPLIYGIIIAKSKLVFMTHDSAVPKAEVRYLHDLDLSEYRGRVWNGLAIMIFICASKKYNMSIRDEYEINDDPPPVKADPNDELD